MESAEFEDIKIAEFSERYAADFASLNYEWIARYFSVEQHDRDILDDPRKWVIDPGGQVFMAVVDEKAVGTVALIPASAELLELTKMAVSPEHQGRGIANLLMARSIEYAREQGVPKIFLESHRSLVPALALYRKFGFVETPPDPNSLYSRADIRMEREIKS